jgi:glycine/D-amino acid oxidase-like deaminating enzyme
VIRRYDLVVLGAGTAGIVASTYAAGLGARVALVEQSVPGGDCLFTGCIPPRACSPRPVWPRRCAAPTASVSSLSSHASTYGA